MGKSCGTFLWEILAGQGGEKANLSKGSDWWKFSIWNKVMETKPIRIQLRKILRESLKENLMGKPCGKFL